MVYYDSQIITSQIVFSSIIVWIFHQVKHSNLPMLSWINENSYKLNRAIAIIASGVVALGIGWQYSYLPDEGVLTLAITGLKYDSIYATAKQWIFSYIVQQTGYRITKPPEDL